MCECKTHCGLLFNHRRVFYQTQNIYQGYITTVKIYIVPIGMVWITVIMVMDPFSLYYSDDSKKEHV